MGDCDLTNTIITGDLEVTGATEITGDFDVATDKVTVDATSGDTVFADGLIVQGEGIVNDGLVLSDVGQIEFPATQDPSAGVNVLDDYEEGTFTPVMAFNGASVGVTYTARGGVYVKVGSVVTINCYIDWSDNGSSLGNFSLLGLPFVADGPYFCTGAPLYSGIGMGPLIPNPEELTLHPMLITDGSGVLMQMCYRDGATACFNQSDSFWANSGILKLSITYKTT